MKAERLLELYDRISAAPDAVSRLRRFVLDLAVRGKLVEQDPEHEPASELLDRLIVEKLRLVEAGEIPKPKNVAITVEDKPFQLSRSWVWARLEDLTEYLQRGKSPKYASGAGHPIISQKCVQWSGLDLSVAKRVDVSSLDTYEPYRFLRNGDLLWNSTGTGTIGRVTRLTDPPQGLICDSHVTVVRCLLVNSEYIRTWLRSDHVYGVIEERAAGGTKQVELTARLARNLPVPLPPLEEQHRIVAKVDELMALCDRLEEQLGTREATRDRLTAAALSRLTAPDTDEQSFRGHARFALDTLPALTARPDQIKALRQTILDLAVRGKLVQRDASDEPVAFKDEAIRDSQEGKPLFEIPRTWRWARLDALGVLKGGGTPDKSREDYWHGSIPWVSPKDMKVPYLEQSALQITERAVANTAVTLIEPSSVLFVVRGMILAHSFPVALARVPLTINQDMKALQLHKPCMAEYVLRALRGMTPEMLKRVQRSSHGTCRIEASDYKNFLLPVPPLAEQNRIIAKVDELMALCDHLETSLQQADSKRARLLESLLAEALAPAEDALEAA